jgi:uncharacterized NAD(P)/FAD-binding protein YdhS
MDASSAMPPHIAIIGGGFSGAVVALQLARKARTPLRVSIFEPRPMLGGGVAYSSPDPAHRINVPATRMTVFSETPTDFHDWLIREDKIAEDPAMAMPDGTLFPKRALFGRYIAEQFGRRGDHSDFVRITHIRDAASRVTAAASGYIIETRQGLIEKADAVVLAVSHPPPAMPARIAGVLGDDKRVIGDPWQVDALDEIRADEDILIMGTGLTMADVVASLAKRGHKGRITAFSRRGLLSRGHDYSAPTSTVFDAMSPPDRALALLQSVRFEIDQAGREGVPWQPVIDGVRANGQRLWGALDQTERSRLLRHLRTYWDVHRYRIAPQVEAVLTQKKQDGSLKTLSAFLENIVADKQKITVGLRPARSPAGSLVQVSVDRIVVTTGPSHGSVVGQNEVLQSLSRQDLIQPDPLGLGVLVNAASETIRTDGRSNPTLWVAGPLARGAFGELMGLPQVTFHATSIAERITARFGALSEVCYLS